ncbi:MAG: hypothetical protein ABRQ37_19240 [Candidatus Eremiobacterota bacterium]
MLSYFLLTKYKVIPIFIKISLLFACIISAVLNILTHPVGAPDIFNYIINCKMAYFYHLNPYIHTFREYFKYDPLIGYTTLSHSTLPYGPLWLLLCYISFHISGFSSILSMLLCYKSFNVAFLIFTALIIYRYEEKDKKWVSLYLYLSNPLILFEGVVNGHNDIIMTFFFIYSIFKLRSNSFFTLPLFTLGSMVKVFILPLLPLFLIEMVRRKWPINKIIASCLLSVFIAICLFIPFRDKNVIKGMLSGMNSYHETRGLSTYGVIRIYMKRNKIEGLSYVKFIWGFIFILFLIAEIFIINTSNSTAFLSLSVIMILPVIIFFIFRILRISNKAVTT